MNNYWNERYSSGGTSGDGSIGDCRKYKWSIIERYVPDILNSSVIDVACGDLSFWEGKDCKDYVGIDASNVIIEKNKENRKKWAFHCMRSGEYIRGLKSNVVFCFDVLFHIMDDLEYYNTLKNLAKYSDNYIFVYTWVLNPFTDPDYIRSKSCHDINKYICFAKKSFGINTDTDGKYQKFRDFHNDRRIITHEGFLTVGIFREPLMDKYGAMYVFKKEKKDE